MRHASDGTQLQPYSNGTTNIVFTAGDKTVTFPVMVTGVTVVGSVSIDKYTEGQEISLEQGKTMTLTATVAPEGNTVNWTSSNTDEVSVTPTTGTIGQGDRQSGDLGLCDHHRHRAA